MKNSRTLNQSASSYWLPVTESIESLNAVTLSSYQRAISNFIRILTKRDDIKVNYYCKDGSSHTDGKTVVISSRFNDKNFDSIVGLALHEGSHIAYTNFDPLKNLPSAVSFHFSKYNVPSDEFLKLTGHVKDILNIIEDRRIDNIVMTTAPGYQNYYKELYKRYFQNKEIDKALRNQSLKTETFESYIFYICNMINENMNVTSLKRLKECIDLIDLPNIGRLNNTVEAFQLALEVAEIIYLAQEPKQKENTKEDPKEEESTESGYGSGSGSSESEESNSKESNSNEEDSNEGDSEESNSNESDSESNESESEEEFEYGTEEDEYTKELIEAIQDQKAFLNGNIDKASVSSKQYKQIQALNDSSVTLKDIEYKSYSKVSKIPALIIKGLSKPVIESGLLENVYNDNSYMESRMHDYRYTEKLEIIKQAIQLGTLLGRRLKVRSEERIESTTRQKSGKIDSRLLHELSFDNGDIFKQIQYNTVTPIYIHISIDASGSMTGDKYNSAIKTAVAIAKACSMQTNIHTVISFRCETCAGFRKDVMPLTWIAYDSKIHNMNYILTHFPNLRCSSSTPESLCFESIYKDVVNAASGKAAYFINFSDGEPGFHTGNISYSGTSAYDHVKSTIDLLRKSGLNICSFFISDSEYESRRSADHFKYMYGTDASFINVDDLNALSKTLNTMLLRA
jgi:hypothetical protein